MAARYAGLWIHPDMVLALSPHGAQSAGKLSPLLRHWSISAAFSAALRRTGATVTLREEIRRRPIIGSRPHEAQSRFTGRTHSFVGSCKRLGADPFAYLKDMLGRLPTHPGERLAELLSDAWFTAHPNTRRKAAS